MKKKFSCSLLTPLNLTEIVDWRNQSATRGGTMKHVIHFLLSPANISHGDLIVLLVCLYALVIAQLWHVFILRKRNNETIAQFAAFILKYSKRDLKFSDPGEANEKNS